MDDIFFMEAALEQARLAGQDVPVGAVLVKDGAIIAAAHNQREKDGSPTAHAEILVIEAAAGLLGTRRLTGCTLYVTLEPCPMCAGALILSGVQRCVFGAYDPQYGCCGSLYALPWDDRFNHRVELAGGVLAREAQALLDAFFAGQRGEAAREG